jgi:hypothetical protein
MWNPPSHVEVPEGGRVGKPSSLDTGGPVGFMGPGGAGFGAITGFCRACVRVMGS